MAFRKTAGAPVNAQSERGRVKVFKTTYKANQRRNHRRVAAGGEPVKRPFLSWDGEGITHPGETQQSYVLFGCSPNEYISSKSLGTAEIFDFIITMGKKYGYSVVHVAFAFNYDVNMMIKDLPMPVLERLSKGQPVWWGDYRIEWLPRKWFRLTKLWKDETGQSQKTSVTIYDVFTFFASSFVSVCEKYLSGEDIELVRRGKLMRDEFTWPQFESVVLPYWQSEITLIAKVMERYRDILYSAGIYITQWYGPGAVASFELKKHHISDHLTQDLPDEVIQASAHAYAGGRFEMFQAGHFDGKVYAYDINSAYPAALTKVRSIAPGYGEWVHHDSVDVSKPISGNMALYHIKYRGVQSFDDRTFEYMYPLFYRDQKGNISFPIVVEGWYWDPEAALVWDDPGAEILECWEFVPSKIAYPFAYIADNFAKRRELKAQKNPAELGLKLGMNSMYGKLAQRVGWDEKLCKPPRWHQLEYAGWITSYTRAMLYRLGKIADREGALIACETDGIYTTIPLDQFCDVGIELGQWEEKIHEGITYVQSGFYWKKTDGVWWAKYRGLDPESVNHDKMMDFLSHVGAEECPECLRIKVDKVKPSAQIEENHNCKYYANTHRFRGLGIALMSREKLDSWRVWSDEIRVFRPGYGEGKRRHNVECCSVCDTGLRFTQGLHPLEITRPGTDGLSVAHNLPWRTGSLTDLQEMAAFTDNYIDVETGREDDGIS